MIGSDQMMNNSKHPIETGRYIICTEQINNAKAIVFNWIDKRMPGAIIYGKPRMGKTSLINYIRRTLNEEFDTPIPTFHIMCKTYASPKESTFFGDLLASVGHSLSLEGSTPEKRIRLNNYLVNTVEKSNQNKLVFFIDDAQRLTDIQYNWLMDIYNELDAYGICLISVLVSQEEIITRLNRFRERKLTQIIGRFMSDDYRFTGVMTKDDLSYLLNEYDEGSEYPVGSNISFTQHYFPTNYEKGFRLFNYLPQLLSAFAQIQDEHDIVEFKEIPMLYITRAVEFILRNYSENEHNVSEITVQNWIEAIEESGYVNANSSLYKDKRLDETYLKRV
ncbi:hypothetical protein BB14905_14850 [Bacillus sp. B14905]|nr:hypothetical protein BB14905_14850 [Bacillus sp. B14905]